jgi:flagellar biosynthetic protein FlhB
MPKDPDKTEQPTPKRLQEARKGGNVPQSMELLSAVSIVALLAALMMNASSTLKWAKRQVKEGFSCNFKKLETLESFGEFAGDKIIEVLMVMAPYMLLMMVASIAASILISGKTWSPKALKLKWNVINPSAGIKKLFSKEALVKLGMGIIKIIFIGIIAWFYVREKLEEIITFQWAWSEDLLRLTGGLIFGVAVRLCIGLVFIGLIDLIYRKWKYIDDLKMSKQEVKDEKKAEDGSPEIKRKIRQKQFEAAMHRMMQDVPKADVVLVNPTHVAVALKYDKEKSAAPIVVAKGKENICEKIKDVARAYGVPIIRRPALARNLFGQVKLGEPIPDSLYVAVAEVLALVYRLKKSRGRLSTV